MMWTFVLAVTTKLNKGKGEDEGEGGLCLTLKFHNWDVKRTFRVRSDAVCLTVGDFHCC